MKRILAVILLLALALTLTACGGNNGEKAASSSAPAPVVTEPPKETEAPAEEPAGTPDGAALADRVEAAVADAADLAPFTADELTDMAGIVPEDYTEFVFLQGDGMDGREVLVIRAADAKAADKVAAQMEEYLKRRMEEMENYAPKAYQILSAAKVERKDLLLVLISGENAEAETAALLAGE